jgi:hypothetical protein
MLHLSVCATAWYTTNCPYIRSAFLDLVSACGIYIIEHGTDDATIGVWNALTTTIHVGPEFSFALSRTGADALLQKSLAEVFFTDRVIVRSEQFEKYQAKDFQSIGSALEILGTEVSVRNASVLNEMEANECTGPGYLRGSFRHTS